MLSARASSAFARGSLRRALYPSMETRFGQEPRRFRLVDGERVPDGVRRIARGQLDVSIERLNGDADENLATAVHETRKSLRRLRATVRLTRDWALVTRPIGARTSPSAVLAGGSSNAHSPACSPVGAGEDAGASHRDASRASGRRWCPVPKVLMS